MGCLIKIHEVTLPKELTHIYILPFSDLHVGDANFDESKFFRYRKWVEDTKNAYVILNGDILNTAIKNSVSDIYSETVPPKEALNTAVKLFEPIKDRILCVIGGNHERRVWREVGLDPSEFLASKLGVYFAGDECYLKIRVGQKRVSEGNTKANYKPVVYSIYATHGWGAGRTPGAKVNNLQKLSDIVLADIYISSHTHFMTGHQDIYLVPEIRSNKLVEMKRTFISSGAFLKRGGYAVTHGYPPAKLGSPRLRLDATRKDVHFSI